MINFREHSDEDIDLRVKWLNDPEVNIYLVDDNNHLTNKVEQEEWMEKYKKSEDKLFYTIMDDIKSIGVIGLSNIDYDKGSANLFIMIGEKEYWSRGYGEKAIDFIISKAKERKIRKITLEVNRNNKNALKLFEKTGFIEIGNSDQEIEMVLSVKSDGLTSVT